jgi:hypothetical protein
MSSLPVAMPEIAEKWLKDPEFRAEYEPGERVCARLGLDRGT